MDPRAQAQSYEVRCHRCNVSFPPEAKTCLHCGARLGLSSERHSFPLGTIEKQEPASPQAPGVARILLWVLSVVVALALSALQTCSRGH